MVENEDHKLRRNSIWILEQALQKESHICVWNVTKKDTGFKSLQGNCWKINQVTPKCKMGFFYKSSKKGLKQQK